MQQIVTIDRDPKILPKHRDKVPFDVNPGRCGETIRVKDKADLHTERLLIGELITPHLLQSEI